MAAGEASFDDRRGSDGAAPVILVVDDTEDVHQHLSALFSTEGWRVASARNAFEAVDLALDVRPDVIMLDLILPEIDGWRVLDELRAQARLEWVPVLVYSQIDDISMISRVLGAGAHDFVAKTASNVELVARITAALRVRRTYIDLARRNRELDALASIDLLTGLSNRRRLLDELEALASGARRRGERLGVILVDIDGFKDVNDTRGHAAGDDALRAVARTLRSSLRSDDLVGRLEGVALGRWGGDEFVIGVSHANADGVATLGARIVDRVREESHTTRVTISAGSAIGDPADLEGLIADADAALYQAKGAGRDQHVPHAAG